jgi:hypothetical protein
MIRAKSIGEVKNIAKIAMDKIANRARNTEIKFNEEKSKAMLLTSTKRKEQKKVAVI